jgi:hypothetical protein
MNILFGMLLIVNGLWMIKDKEIGYGYTIGKEVHGWELYAYTVPLIFFGIYVIYSEFKKDK